MYYGVKGKEIDASTISGSPPSTSTGTKRYRKPDASTVASEGSLSAESCKTVPSLAPTEVEEASVQTAVSGTELPSTQTSSITYTMLIPSTEGGDSVYHTVKSDFALRADFNHYWFVHATKFMMAGFELQKLFRKLDSDEMNGKEAQQTRVAIRSAIEEATEILCELGLCCGRRKPEPGSTGNEVPSGSDTCTTANIARTKNISRDTMKLQYDKWKIYVKAWAEDLRGSEASAEEGEASVPIADADQQSEGEPTENRRRPWLAIVTDLEDPQSGSSS